MSNYDSIPEEVRKSLAQAEAIMKAANDAVARSGVVIDDLGVAASPDGKVAISGIAQSSDAAVQAGRAVAALAGVTGVINSIIVLEGEAK